MKQLEMQLPSNFIRIHNSYIVNLNRVEKIIDNHVVISEARLPTSAGYREQLVRIIDQKLL